MLGFSSLFNDQLQIDVHALNDADNSIFIGVSALPRILFDDGGVDDAEDTQVIVHELGHALIYASSPDSNVGLERNAINEGVGNSLTTSYTRILKPSSNWANVPSCDGHNEFWNGRVVISNKKYPDDLSAKLYQDAEIWSSSIMEVEIGLGRDLTHKILIESSFFYHELMVMVQAVNYFYCQIVC